MATPADFLTPHRPRDGLHPSSPSAQTQSRAVVVPASLPQLPALHAAVKTNARDDFFRLLRSMADEKEEDAAEETHR